MQKSPEVPKILQPHGDNRLMPDFPIYARAYKHHPGDPAANIADLHLHSCLEVGYCHAGRGVLVVEDKMLPYNAGDVAVINNRELHLLRGEAETASDWMFFWVDPTRLIGLTAEDPSVLRIDCLGGPDFPNIISGSEHPEIVSLVQSILDELAAQAAGYHSAVRGLVWALMARLQRLPGQGTGEVGTVHAGIDRVAPALHHMARHYCEPIRIEELSELCHASSTHFRRVFQTVTGKSPLKYLTQLRIRMATTLIQRGGQSMQEIAREIGYTTLSSFNRHFKSIMGTSPRQWRRANQRRPAARAAKNATAAKK